MLTKVFFMIIIIVCIIVIFILIKRYRSKKNLVDEKLEVNNIEMKERARNFFLLADRYLETAKLTLNTIIEGDNFAGGFGRNLEELENDLRKNLAKSDFMLLIPTIFNSLQSVELFLKGLLLLNSVEIQNEHETCNMIAEIKKIYGEKSEQYKSINAFYKHQIEIVKEFKKINGISTTSELYESLRYPEDNNEDINNKKFYVYYNLHNNGDLGKQYFKTLIKKMQRVKNAVEEEYKKNY